LTVELTRVRRRHVNINMRQGCIQVLRFFLRRLRTGLKTPFEAPSPTAALVDNPRFIALDHSCSIQPHKAMWGFSGSRQYENETRSMNCQREREVQKSETPTKRVGETVMYNVSD